MIMGHAARKLDVSKRYGFIDENELVNAIDKLTYDHGLTQILDLRPKNRYSGMSDVTFFVKALIHESVLQWSMFKNPNDLWCLRTDSNRHGDMPQGILSPLCLPIPPLRLVGVRLPGRNKAVGQF